MRHSSFHVKLVPTLIFAPLSACVLGVLHAGVFGRIDGWTWVAVALVLVEGVVLAGSGGRCPLTVVAERLGAANGSVADIFLPKWAADRKFPVGGTGFAIGCVLIAGRLLT